MRLPRPFFRLPLRFDAARLRAEVAALPAEAWAAHPNAIAGNSSVRLISVDGGENDDVAGAMRPTPHLQRSPYLRQVLARFGVVWSRSRLLRLAPGANVPQHADINHHWFYRVRVHIPIITRAEVLFRCDGETVHMAPGEAWVFDNWRQHSVENPTSEERVHLVADTSGTAAFWQMVAEADQSSSWPPFAFDASREAAPLTEQVVPPPVMAPAEVELLINDLRNELAPGEESAAAMPRAVRYDALLNAFCRDWRQSYALHGDAAESPDYAHLRDGLRAASRSLGEGLVMRGNRVAAHQVLEGRVLRALLNPSTSKLFSRNPSRRITRPVFIVAAPRSGSTLLFETLAVSPGVCTLGGEGHFVFEGLEQLQPGASGVESNRLTASQATDVVGTHIEREILARRQTFARMPVAPESSLRFVEKTPKNVLRIPFLDALFPDARFIFLWREPRANVSSIIEAWRSGRFKTYAGLDGFDGPWSLLLPPDWQRMSGRSLEEIAAFQWESANRIALDDLSMLPAERWCSVDFDDFLNDPQSTMRRLCAFSELDFDAALAARVAAPLPPSRQTHTPPAADKWRANADLLDRVLPQLELTHARLRALRR